MIGAHREATVLGSSLPSKLVHMKVYLRAGTGLLRTRVRHIALTTREFFTRAPGVRC